MFDGRGVVSMKIDHLYHLDQRLNGLVDPLQSPISEDMDDVNLWIPSERISLHLVDIPSAPERKWPDLLPWILEDRLLQAPEDMHFVVASRTSEQLQVIAVSRQDLSEWIRIAENAGANGAVVAENVKSRSNNEGYNAANGDYVDMLAAGIVDPAKVTRSGLQNAASIAGMVLTTECIVADLPEKKDASPAGGGMGGGDFDY